MCSPCWRCIKKSDIHCGAEIEACLFHLLSEAQFQCWAAKPNGTTKMKLLLPLVTFHFSITIFIRFRTVEQWFHSPCKWMGWWLRNRKWCWIESCQGRSVANPCLNSSRQLKSLVWYNRWWSEGVLCGFCAQELLHHCHCWSILDKQASCLIAQWLSW